MHRSFIGLMSILVLGLTGVLLGACQDKNAESVSTEATIAPPTRVVAAAHVKWPRLVNVPATVSAVEAAKLASRAGGRVTRVNVVAGTHVAQGALLADVGIADARDQLAQAQANLATAQASYNEAAANEQRYAALYRTHVTSAQQYDAMHRGFLAAKAQLAAAKSALTTAKSNLNYAEIRAPFAGTIAEKNVKTGDFAAPGAALFVIAGDTPEIRAHVGPAIYGALKVGDRADVAINGKTWPATITLADASADPNTRTHLIELHLRGPARAPYGAYADVRLRLGRFPMVAVPATALVRRAGLLGVFVVDHRHHAHFRLVRTGQRQDGQVAIVAGLTAGEMVVTAPRPGLVNDSPVTPTNVAPVASGSGTTRG